MFKTYIIFLSILCPMSFAFASSSGMDTTDDMLMEWTEKDSLDDTLKQKGVQKRPVAPPAKRNKKRAGKKSPPKSTKARSNMRSRSAAGTRSTNSVRQVKKPRSASQFNTQKSAVSGRQGLYRPSTAQPLSSRHQAKAPKLQSIAYGPQKRPVRKKPMQSPQYVGNMQDVKPSHLRPQKPKPTSLRPPRKPQQKPNISPGWNGQVNGASASTAQQNNQYHQQNNQYHQQNNQYHQQNNQYHQQNNQYNARRSQQHTPLRGQVRSTSNHQRNGLYRPYSARLNRHRVGAYSQRTYQPVRPYHGVLVYGPRPTYHNSYSGGNLRPASIQEKHLPKRQVNREGSFAVGLRTGSYISGYEDSAGYADFGMGGTLRYRPAEAVGIELAVNHHDQTFRDDSERTQTLGQASVMLFAFPWNRVSPYVVAGMSVLGRDVADEIMQEDSTTTVTTQETLFGPHGGIGMEIALGKSIAIDLEARYTGFVNRPAEDLSLPGSLTTTAGLLVHF